MPTFAYLVIISKFEVIPLITRNRDNYLVIISKFEALYFKREPEII